MTAGRFRPSHRHGHLHRRPPRRSAPRAPSRLLPCSSPPGSSPPGSALGGYCWCATSRAIHRPRARRQRCRRRLSAPPRHERSTSKPSRRLEHRPVFTTWRCPWAATPRPSWGMPASRGDARRSPSIRATVPSSSRCCSSAPRSTFRATSQRLRINSACLRPQRRASKASGSRWSAPMVRTACSS